MDYYPTDDPNDLYGVLGLLDQREEATPREIFDVYKSMSTREKSEAHEAYQIISNPKKKLAYHMSCLGVPDHYEVLELSDRKLRATPEEIKAKFKHILGVTVEARRSAERSERNPELPLSDKLDLAVAVADLKDASTKAHTAYLVLSDPKSRRPYDKLCWEIEHLLPICSDSIKTAEKKREYDKLCLEVPHLLPIPISSEKEEVKEREEDNRGESHDQAPSPDEENKGESLDGAVTDEEKKELRGEEKEVREEEKKELRGEEEKKEVACTDEEKKEVRGDEKKEVRGDEKEVREEEKKELRGEEKEVREEEKKVKPSSDVVAPDHYRALGLSVNATIDEIKEKFQALHKKHSDAVGCSEPDGVASDSESERKAIDDAYQVLIDPSRRAEYDEFYRAAQHRPQISADSHKHETPITTLEGEEEKEKEKENERLDDNFSVLEQYLQTLVDLNDLYMSRDKDAVDALHVQELKNLSEDIETLNSIFSGSLEKIERLRKKLALLKQTSSSTHISGDFRKITYSAVRQHVSDTLDYYEAIINFEDGVRGYKSFLRSNTAEDAVSTYNLSKDVKPDRVSRPELYFKHDEIPLLSCERFSHIKADSKLVTELASPRAYSYIVGYPNKYTQNEIRGILQGVKDLTEENCMSSDFTKPSFVFSPQKKAKILRADLPLTDGIVSEADMSRLMEGVNGLFLAEDGNEVEDKEEWDGYKKKYPAKWELRKIFLDAFRNKKVPLEKRLDMLITFPFLKPNMWEVVRFFVDVHHAIWLRIPYMDTDLWTLRNTLFNDKAFKDKFLKNESWARRKGVVPSDEQWTDAWQRVFDYKHVEKVDLSEEREEESGDKKLNLDKKGKGKIEEDDKKGNYDEKNIMDLVKFLRHTIIHYLHRKDGMSLLEIFSGINKYWPGLIEMCHQKIFACT